MTICRLFPVCFLERGEQHKQFIEYTTGGYPTTFTITTSDPYRRWEFDMENSNMNGHSTGIFTEKDGQVEINFTENVTVMARKIQNLRTFLYSVQSVDKKAESKHKFWMGISGFRPRNPLSVTIPLTLSWRMYRTGNPKTGIYYLPRF